MVDPRVSCPSCIQAEADSSWGRPGNPARPAMGHAMYFTHTGRIAACAARPLACAAAEAQWKATHRITTPYEQIEVMLVGGVAYTREEWESESSADYEVVNGEWLFQGEPFTGEVESLLAQ